MSNSLEQGIMVRSGYRPGRPISNNSDILIFSCRMFKGHTQKCPESS